MKVGNMLPTARKELQGKDLQDEYLVWDGSGDRLHVLNSTARAIFLLCDGEHTEEQIAESLVTTFQIDLETATADVQRTLKELGEIGLIGGVASE